MQMSSLHVAASESTSSKVIIPQKTVIAYTLLVIFKCKDAV